MMQAAVGCLRDDHAWSGYLFVVQGEFGYIFAVVDYAIRQGLVSLYASTVRVAKETLVGAGQPGIYP